MVTAVAQLSSYSALPNMRVDDPNGQVDFVQITFDFSVVKIESLRPTREEGAVMVRIRESRRDHSSRPRQQRYIKRHSRWLGLQYDNRDQPESYAGSER